jgi:5'(3')-deoxyribonucleotidase
MKMQKPLVVYIDMDDVLCDYNSAHRAKLETNPSIAFPQSQYGFFASLQPIEGSIESVKALIQDKRFSPYILTAPSYVNPLCYTEKRVWIETYFGLDFTRKLIISPDKSLFKGDVLIDDNAFGKGQEGFEGKLFQFGAPEFQNWQLVMKRLFELVE